MLVDGLSGVCEYVEVKPLNSSDKEAGTEIVAGLLYEELPGISMRIMFVFWVIMISIPRILEWFDNRKKKKAAESGGSTLAAIAKETGAPITPAAV